MPIELTGDVVPPAETWDKIICQVHGLTGVGKSRFALTFPGPIWYFNLDRAIGHFKAAWATRKITYEASTVDVDTASSGQAALILAKFDVLVKQCLASAEPGTFIVDAWDIFWDVVKLAKVKNLDSDVPKEYALANEYMNNHTRRLGLSKHNVVFTTMSSPIWTGMKTVQDKMKPDGYKHGGRWLTHEVYLFAPDEMEHPAAAPKVGQVGQSHSAYVARSKLNEALIGRIVPGLDFAMLYKLTFGKAYAHPEKLWRPNAMNVAVAENAPTED